MRKTALLMVFAMLSTGIAKAQRVLYSSFFPNTSSNQCSPAGTVNGFYWVQQTTRSRYPHRSGKQASERTSFAVYDSRLEHIRDVDDVSTPEGTIKQYLVAGKTHFDLLSLTRAGGKTNIVLQRYSADGSVSGPDRTITALSNLASWDDFLLVISQDRAKILLLCFETSELNPSRFHALLFNSDWELISSQSFDKPGVSRPFIQDDLIALPAAQFDPVPLQLANNGEWVMACPSRTTQGYLLVHCRGDSLHLLNISTHPSYTTADIALFLDNESNEVSIGILSAYRLTTHRNVRITRYALQRGAFEFDTSYHFNTLAGEKLRNENLAKEIFYPANGKGFMLLKEYGRPFASAYLDDPYDYEWDPALVFGNNNFMSASPSSFGATSDGYTRYSSLIAAKGGFERGDLNVFFFPSSTHDSSWSGMISKPQITELNAPALSYLMIPGTDRLYFLYNSSWGNDDQAPASTVLGLDGQLRSNEGVLFWKMNYKLAFQRAVRVSNNEQMMLYYDHQRIGLAVVRF